MGRLLLRRRLLGRSFGSERRFERGSGRAVSRFGMVRVALLGCGLESRQTCCGSVCRALGPLGLEEAVVVCSSGV